MKTKITILAIILSIVVLQAVSDALFHIGNKDVSKIIEVTYIAFFFVLAYFKLHWTIVFSYVMFRVVFFGVIFNITAGLAWNYCGITTAFYDQIFCPIIHSAMYPIFFIVFNILAVSLFIRFYKL